MKLYRIVMRNAALVVVAALGCGTPGDYKGRAKTAVAAFHQGLNRGAFHELYESSDVMLRGALTPEQFNSYVGFVVSALGRVEGTENINTATAVVTGRGWVVDARQKTRFTKGQANEHFVWKVEGDKLLLQIYEVRSPLLGPKISPGEQVR